MPRCEDQGTVCAKGMGVQRWCPPVGKGAHRGMGLQRGALLTKYMNFCLKMVQFRARWRTSLKFTMTGTVTEKVQLRLIALKLHQITKARSIHTIHSSADRMSKTGYKRVGFTNTKPHNKKWRLESPSPTPGSDAYAY